MTSDNSKAQGHEANPYASPLRHPESMAVRSRSFSSFLKSTLCWLLYFYPLIMIFLTYTSWGLTYWRLGREPIQPDHPGTFPANVIGFFGLLGLVLSPFLLPAGAIIASVLPSPVSDATGAAAARRLPVGRTRSWSASTYRVLMVVGYTLLLLLAWWFVFADPYGAVYWLRD